MSMLKEIVGPRSNTDFNIYFNKATRKLATRLQVKYISWHCVPENGKKFGSASYYKEENTGVFRACDAKHTQKNNVLRLIMRGKMAGLAEE